jgi:hypothetical protein
MTGSDKHNESESTVDTPRPHSSQAPKVLRGGYGATTVYQELYQVLLSRISLQLTTPRGAESITSFFSRGKNRLREVNLLAQGYEIRKEAAPLDRNLDLPALMI